MINAAHDKEFMQSGDMTFDALADRYLTMARFRSNYTGLTGEELLITALIEEVRRLRAMLEPVR